MMRFSFIAAAAFVLLCCLALFVSAAELSNKKQFAVTFHLNRINSKAKIDKEFADRSTPGNALFRQWLSKEQLVALYRAPDEVIDAATTLLASADVGCRNVELGPQKDMIHCMIDTQSPLHGGVLARFGEAPELAPSVTIKHFPQLRRVMRLCRTVIAYRLGAKSNELGRKKKKNQSSKLGEPGMQQSPATINQRYGVPAANTLVIDTNLTVAVAEFENSYYSLSDLNMFSQRYLGGASFTPKNMGPWQPAGGGAGATEGTLDLEYITSINNATLPTFWIGQSSASGGSEPGEINFAKLFSQIAALDDIPGVVSVSWGLSEGHYAYALDDMTEAAAAFAKAGFRGISVFAASGDSGPGTRNGIFDCNSFQPSFPASADTLTTVGATYADSQSAKESTVNWSGGGFSNQFGMPAWQRQAVQNYIATAAAMPKPSFYNSSGRAYPDVSALGTNFMISIHGQWEPVSGTSAASPTFAGIVGLIQSVRKAAGKPLLGFINPVIYAAGKVGFDVTQGSTVDMNCLPFFPENGFPTAKGWDACTGLGTPIFATLLNILDF